MLSLRRGRPPREQGFTLIELLTVVAIIGVLAAIGIPVFSSQRGRAADAASTAEARTTVLAMESYIALTPTGRLEDADPTQPEMQLPAHFAAELVAHGSAAREGDSRFTMVRFSNGKYLVTTGNSAGRNTQGMAYWNADVLTASAGSTLQATFEKRGTVADFTTVTNAISQTSWGVIAFDAENTLG